MMSSDKLEARREARRRKILENSENRLKLITGKSGLDKNSGTKSGCEENGILNIPEVIMNGEINHETLLRNISVGLTNIPEDDEELSSVNVYASYQPIILIFISLAILFRLALEMGIQCIFTNSMVVTFMLAKSGTLVVYGVPIHESSRFIGNLLLLSGISSSKIKLLTFVLSALFNVLRDFALYTFIFVCVDLCLHISKLIL